MFSRVGGDRASLIWVKRGSTVGESGAWAEFRKFGWVRSREAKTGGSTGSGAPATSLL